MPRPSWTATPPLPRELQVEVTASCNLRCRMCLVRYQPPVNRIEGSMSFTTFRRIVDQLPDLRMLTLQGLGEPLLAPDLFRMIEYGAARGIRMGFNTNATLLTRARADRLVAAGLAWLHVSLDAADAATYASIRDGASFERVARHVRGLVDAKRTVTAEHPDIQIVMVLMRRNLGQLVPVVELAAEWGVLDLWVQNLSHSFDDAATGGYDQIRTFTAQEALWRDDAPSVAETYAQARARAAALGVRLRLPRTEQRAPRRSGTPGCDWPWRSVYVTHDGRVQPCCMLMGDRGMLGSIHERSFEEIWHGDAYRAMREQLLGDHPPAVCEGCSLYRSVF